MADKFDTKSAFSIKYLDVRSFANKYYKFANPSNDHPESIEIDEMSISANELQSELEKKRFDWKGVDDEVAKKTP